jgi:hypothetical protein
VIVRDLTIAVVGAAHPNKDGGNRRSEIAFCNPGEPIELRPEPKNRHDEHAIAVFSARRFQIGYVASERAVTLKGLMRAGHELVAIFQDVAPFGALVRVGIDQTPTLPPARPSEDEDRDEYAQPDPGDWPDEPPPDE